MARFTDLTDYTSQPYPVVQIDYFSTLVETVQSGSLNVGLYAIPAENFSNSAVIASGVLSIGMVPYNNYAPENFSVGAATLVSGILDITTGYVAYSNYAAENFSLAAGTITGGTLTLGLIQYNNYKAENFSLSATLTGGSLA
jgi:hypothetical protein